MVEDNLSLGEVIHAALEGEEVESYPEDFPFPSFLIYGCGEKGEPIHTVWAYDESKRMATLVTAYRPDPDRWVDFRERR